jgi:hypothetical protein
LLLDVSKGVLERLVEGDFLLNISSAEIILHGGNTRDIFQPLLHAGLKTIDKVDIAFQVSEIFLAESNALPVAFFTMSDNFRVDHQLNLRNLEVL